MRRGDGSWLLCRKKEALCTVRMLPQDHHWELAVLNWLGTNLHCWCSNKTVVQMLHVHPSTAAAMPSYQL